MEYQGRSWPRHVLILAVYYTSRKAPRACVAEIIRRKLDVTPPSEEEILLICARFCQIVRERGWQDPYDTASRSWRLRIVDAALTWWMPRDEIKQLVYLDSYTWGAIHSQFA